MKIFSHFNGQLHSFKNRKYCYYIIQLIYEQPKYIENILLHYLYH
jgi:hypothetical protein